MNLDLPDVAVSFGVTAARAFRAAGGVDLARRAEVDPSIRATVVVPLLDDLGLSDLRMGVDLDTDLAAAELCRAAGAVALPYPLPAILASADGAARPLAVIPPGVPRADHGDLFPRWRLATIDGTSSWDAEPADPPLRTRLGPFVCDLRTTGDDLGACDVSAYLALSACQILGVLERAVDLTVEHVAARRQFGRPLGTFQSVQFQVADATVAVRSLRELSRFTMWRLATDEAPRAVDALALRVHALETAVQVLRTCHQLHGAVGLADEHDLSILDRHTQPQLRHPVGLEATIDLLLATIDAAGFDSLSSPAGDLTPAPDRV